MLWLGFDLVPMEIPGLVSAARKQVALYLSLTKVTNSQDGMVDRHFGLSS